MNATGVLSCILIRTYFPCIRCSSDVRVSGIPVDLISTHIRCGISFDSVIPNVLYRISTLSVHVSVYLAIIPNAISAYVILINSSGIFVSAV